MNSAGVGSTHRLIGLNVGEGTGVDELHQLSGRAVQTDGELRVVPVVVHVDAQVALESSFVPPNVGVGIGVGVGVGGMGVGVEVRVASRSVTSRVPCSHCGQP